MENQQSTSILQCSEADDHAIVLIDVNQGDLVAAWVLALDCRAFATDEEERGYWTAVAEAIARRRSESDPLFLRGHQFDA